MKLLPFLHFSINSLQRLRSFKNATFQCNLFFLSLFYILPPLRSAKEFICDLYIFA